MGIADIVGISLIAIFALLGLLIGFGKGLRFFTTGFIGFLVSILVCYLIGGLVIKLTFVQELLDKLINAMTGKGGVCDFLLKIHIELIVYYIVLFIIVVILQHTVVKLIAAIFEAENFIVKTLNRVLGIALFLCVLILLAMIAFQIVSLIGGTTAAGLQEKIANSVIKLDWLYNNNPLMSIIGFITSKG